MDFPEQGEDEKLYIVLGWDFHSVLSINKAYKFLQKSVEEAINNHELEELVAPCRIFRDELNKLLDKYLSNTEIAGFIVSPGNHDLWARYDYAFEDNSWLPKNNIKEVLNLTLNVVKNLFEYLYPNVPVTIQNEFSETLELAPGIHIASGMFYSPLEPMHEDIINIPKEEMPQFIINTLEASSFFKEAGTSFLVNLGREAGYLQDMKDPFIGMIDALEEGKNFSYLGLELQRYLLNLHEAMLKFCRENNSFLLWSKYVYFTKALLYWFSDINNIFKLSNELVVNDTLIINQHFPFDFLKISEVNKQAFDLYSMNIQYQFPNTDKSAISKFFNIDFNWFFYFLSWIKQKNIIILCGHTHEQYKVEIVKGDKNIFVVNNNLGYGW